MKKANLTSRLFSAGPRITVSRVRRHEDSFFFDTVLSA